MQNSTKFKKGLIITNAFNVLTSTEHMVKRLIEEFKELGVELERRNASEIFAYINDNGEIQPKAFKYDFVIFLDKDKYIAKLLERAGYRLFNSAYALEVCDDKMETYIALTNSSLKMPLTVSAPIMFEKSDSSAFLNNLESVLSFPIVVKSNYGSMGKGVFLAKDKNELIDISDELALVPHLYQKFISSSKGFDYRVIVIGNKVVAAMKRESLTGDFRSNLALGGKGEPISLNKDFKNAAIKAARILKLDYCGVDLLEGENKEPIICEVNSNAFIKGIEEITGVNVAKKYAKHVIKEIYK